MKSSNLRRCVFGAFGVIVACAGTVSAVSPIAGGVGSAWCLELQFTPDRLAAAGLDVNDADSILTHLDQEGATLALLAASRADVVACAASVGELREDGGPLQSIRRAERGLAEALGRVRDLRERVTTSCLEEVDPTRRARLLRALSVSGGLPAEYVEGLSEANDARLARRALIAEARSDRMDEPLVGWARDALSSVRSSQEFIRARRDLAIHRSTIAELLAR